MPVTIKENDSLSKSRQYKSFSKTYLNLIRHYQKNSIEDIQEEVEKKLGFILNALKQRLSSIQTFAAVTPLLGLLGTVNGMIVTFDVINHYGNASPILLSDGISEALLTTQSGLVIAFPLLIFQVFFKNRTKDLENYMQEALINLKGDMIDFSPSTPPKSSLASKSINKEKNKPATTSKTIKKSKNSRKNEEGGNTDKTNKKKRP